jgi:squalene-hopene/tetraprenyl-beta-curcumene cyclase
MNSTELVLDLTNRTRPRRDANWRATPLFRTELVGPVRQAILRARQHLLADQRSDGAWLGRQTTDASSTALVVFWLAYTNRANSELAQQCAAAILELQLPEGGWSRTPGGPADVSVGVQAYFALKLVGIDPTSTSLVRAREIIRTLGGADTADATTRIILALFGQIGYEHCARATSGRMLFDFECARQTPYATILARKPICKTGCEHGVRELFLNRPCDWPMVAKRDLGGVHEAGATQIDELSFEQLVWHMIALHSDGVSLADDQMKACDWRLGELVIADDDDNAARPICSPRPIADTAISLESLLASGVSPAQEAIGAALDIVCGETGRRRSTTPTTHLCKVLSALQLTNAPAVDAGYLPPEFELLGDWSQDTNAWTSEINQSSADSVKNLVAELCEELIVRQNSDGGWGDLELSVSQPHVTSSVLEAIANCEHTNTRSSINRAIEYLRESQQGDGSWLNVNQAEPIRATSSAIRGLTAAGVPSEDDVIAAGLNWLVVEQQRDGGWREGTGNTNPSPTSWVVLAFVAAGESNHKACRRGIHFLVDAQGDDGRWTDANFAIYDAALNRWIHNDLHSTAWPLLALSRWAVTAMSARSEASGELSLRLVNVSADE